LHHGGANLAKPRIPKGLARGNKTYRLGICQKGCYCKSVVWRWETDIADGGEVNGSNFLYFIYIFHGVFMFAVKGIYDGKSITTEDPVPVVENSPTKGGSI
jgi:hypothetical protein